MKSFPKAPACPSGFTLIELMVVMLLISIVLGVAIPKFSGGAFQDPVKKLSRWMVISVRNLRSAAIQKQIVQALVIDIDNHRMWLIDDQMSEEALAAASDKAMTLPDSLHLVDVRFPGQEPVTSGTTEVKFYPAGFSDQALIHLQSGDAERFSYLVEPLLPKAKFFEEWIEF
jgi:prepilin-type N-terminal cleavage/methylation domain-containing protein